MHSIKTGADSILRPSPEIFQKSVKAFEEAVGDQGQAFAFTTLTFFGGVALMLVSGACEFGWWVEKVHDFVLDAVVVEYDEISNGGWVHVANRILVCCVCNDAAFERSCYLVIGKTSSP